MLAWLAVLAFSVSAHEAPSELLRGVDPRILSATLDAQRRAIPEPTALPACYRLTRRLWRKASTEPRESFKEYDGYRSYVSKPLLPNIHMILTPWSYADRAELLTYERFSLSSSGALTGGLSLETQKFPLGNKWRLIWTKALSLKLGESWIFESSISGRDFKIEFAFAEEPISSLCRLPTARRP
jgi:hypothetical protein